MEYKRTIVSVLSFFAWNHSKEKDFRILLFTDNPEYFYKYFEDIQIEYIRLTPEWLDEMLGGTTYIHRRKIGVIRDAYSRYPDSAILFLDSDTFFIADSGAFLRQLENGFSLMHEQEYRFSEGPEIYRTFMSKRLKDAEQYPLAFLDLISNRSFLIGGKEVRFTADQRVWNSGVLGLSNPTWNLLDEVLSINDLFFSETGWFISEQLAFGLILQQETTILPSCRYTNHYHQSKDCVDGFVDKFVSAHLAELSLKQKSKRAKAFSINANRLTIFDSSISISVYAFKKRNIKKGFRFAVRAVTNMPFSKMLFKYVETRYRGIKKKQSK